jgi:hypothetical protein
MILERVCEFRSAREVWTNSEVNVGSRVLWNAFSVLSACGAVAQGAPAATLGWVVDPRWGRDPCAPGLAQRSPRSHSRSLRRRRCTAQPRVAAGAPWVHGPTRDPYAESVAQPSPGSPQAHPGNERHPPKHCAAWAARSRRCRIRRHALRAPSGTSRRAQQRGDLKPRANTESRNESRILAGALRTVWRRSVHALRKLLLKSQGARRPYPRRSRGRIRTEK